MQLPTARTASNTFDLDSQAYHDPVAWHRPKSLRRLLPPKEQAFPNDPRHRRGVGRMGDRRTIHLGEPGPRRLRTTPGTVKDTRPVPG